MGQMIKPAVQSPKGFIRKLWPTDLEAFRDHLLRLDTETRHSRFGMGASDAFIADYAQRSFTLVGVTYGYFEDGLIRGAAELRDMGHDGQDGEAAFSIEDGWRGRGLGTALFKRVIRAARNRHMKRLYASCLSHNHAMQALARKFEAELTFDSGDVIGILNADEATAETQISEALDDASGFATAVLDLQRRWLQPFPLRGHRA
jgi:RimJ/RimL family protein N-acetyltransferase